MSEKPENPYIFPQQQQTYQCEEIGDKTTFQPFGAPLFVGGMTLRDYFAAAALQGMLAADDRVGCEDDHARYSYLHADAMLRARNKP